MNKTDPHPVNLVNPVKRLSEFYSNFWGLMACSDLQTHCKSKLLRSSPEERWQDDFFAELFQIVLPRNHSAIKLLDFIPTLSALWPHHKLPA